MQVCEERVGKAGAVHTQWCSFLSEVEARLCTVVVGQRVGGMDF